MRKRLDLFGQYDKDSMIDCGPLDILYGWQHKERRLTMKTDYQEKRFLAKNQVIGIDVHKESWQVAIRAEG